MTDEQHAFLKLFFEEGEAVCVSHNKLAWHAVPLRNLYEERITLVSPNEDIDDVRITPSMINMVAINPMTPGDRRTDENVTSYRSFLVEVDDGKLSEQMGYVRSTDMPWSACVFSGGKSLHFGIVLDEPLPSLTMYRHISRWILNIMEKADPLTLNPSRSIRFPGNKRRVYGHGLAAPEERKEQRLVEIRHRVSQAELFSWLSGHKDKRPRVRRKKKISSTPPSFKKLPKWVRQELKEGVPGSKRGGRNKTWYSIAFEFAQQGFDIDDTFEILEDYFLEEHDFQQREWEYTVARGVKDALEKCEE